MKRVRVLGILLLCLYFMNGNVQAETAPQASSGMTYQSCIAFSDTFTTIQPNIGSKYYRYCYRASCNNGKYQLGNMVGDSGYRCGNGNGTPYTKITSDGCGRYSGTCNTKNAPYCTRVEFVDCNKNKDGSTYAGATTTTKKTTTKRTTTKTKAPQKTTTTKKTTRPTTKRTHIVIPPSTKGTTTTKPTVTQTNPTTAPAIRNNTNIKSITINGLVVEYQNGKEEYNAKLPYGIDSIEIGIELEDETSTYEVTGNTNMPDEDTQVLITVIAQDGTKKVVTFNIQRYTELSKDCNLANIHIEGYNLDFSKTVYDYKLTLPKNVNDLDLEVLASDEQNASVEINGNEKLKNRSVIDIIVTAEDGTECKYTIKIRKNSNTWKYIVLIILLAGALGVSIYFLYKYLKKSKGKYKYE